MQRYVLSENKYSPPCPRNYILFVRKLTRIYCQSEHKQAGHDKPNYNIADPRLSQAGRQQCIAFKEQLSNTTHAENITHVLASPLTRSLETALLAFGEASDRGVKILAMAELQSMSDCPSSIGMSVNELKEHYGNSEVGHEVSRKVNAFTTPKFVYS